MSETRSRWEDNITSQGSIKRRCGLDISVSSRDWWRALVTVVIILRFS
jgi:hypothetical protein